MEEKNRQLNEISEIRTLMERSTQYLSLSGLSGVAAGIIALLGAGIVYYDFAYLAIGGYSYDDFATGEGDSHFLIAKIWFLVKVAFLVLFFAVSFGFYFTWKKAKKNNYKMWNAPARRLFLDLFIPLSTGGIFCLILLHHELYGFVAPAMLIFYGMALFSAGKFTYRHIRYLGITEIILGLIASFYIGYGLLFWAVGFGVLHILYGIAMYFKYDRN